MGRAGRALICVAAVLALTMTPALARKKPNLPVWDWGLSVALGSGYDDNVLGFSERDRISFLHDPAAFPTPLKSVDDLETNVQISPSLRWRAPATLMVGVDYRFKGVTRARNAFSDYQTHTFNLSLRPRVTGYMWQTRLRVFTIPSFYLREYRDRDYDEYFSTRYREWEYEGSLKYRLLEPLWVEARAAYATYYYNAKFTEYDNEQRSASVGASYRLPWDATLAAAYTRRLSDNVGKNQIGALTATPVNPDQTGDSEYGDADFHEDDWTGTLTVLVPWIRFVKTEAALSYRLRRRAYVTSRTADQDPVHRGRLDRRAQVTASFTIGVFRALEAEPYFSYEQRRTESPVETVPLAKNFTRHEYGLTLTYTVR